MTRRGMGWVLVATMSISGGVWMAATAHGQAQPAKPAARPAGKPQATPPRGAAQAPDRPAREITLTGKVVTVQTYMMPGPGTVDATRAVADSLRASGAAALESPMGLVILGQGNTGASRLLMAHAYQQVEVHGKLFEKGGVKYLDIDTIAAVEEEEGEPEEDAAEDDGE